MAFSGAQLTRLGPCGGPRALYGSFVGKTLAEAVTAIVNNLSIWYGMTIQRMGL